jgi:hypothetical protein
MSEGMKKERLNRRALLAGLGSTAILGSPASAEIENKNPASGADIVDTETEGEVIGQNVFMQKGVGELLNGTLGDEVEFDVVRRTLSKSFGGEVLLSPKQGLERIRIVLRSPTELVFKYYYPDGYESVSVTGHLSGYDISISPVTIRR